MKILITGGKGQLGSQIINILKNGTSEIGDISSAYKNAEIIGTDSQELDISDLNSVREYFKKEMPDVVINSAAYTNVDGCEGDQELAFKVNALGARNVAIAAQGIGAKLLHISTDYVFPGDGKEPYREYDIVGPVSVYGKTKLMGEEYVKQFSNRYFIVRTSWLYGYNGNNFVKTIMKAARERGHLEVVDDQRGNPTNAEDLAFHILKIILTDEFGIYHCTGTGECSWYSFAKKIIELAGIECSISPIKSDMIKRVAKRPEYSSLDNMMLRCTVGDYMRDWEDAIEVFINNINK